MLIKKLNSFTWQNNGVSEGLHRLEVIPEWLIKGQTGNNRAKRRKQVTIGPLHENDICSRR